MSKHIRIMSLEELKEMAVPYRSRKVIKVVTLEEPIILAESIGSASHHHPRIYRHDMFLIFDETDTRQDPENWPSRKYSDYLEDYEKLE